MEQKILNKLRGGPMPGRLLPNLFPTKHPDATGRAIYSLLRAGKIFVVRQGVFKAVSAGMSEQDYIDLTHAFRDVENSSLKPQGLQRCTVCGHVKPLEDYYIEKRFHDGHRPDCKACVRERTIANRKVRKEREEALLQAGVQTQQTPELKTRVCKQCGIEQPINNFPLRPETATRRSRRLLACHECDKARRKAYNARVTEQRRRVMGKIK